MSTTISSPTASDEPRRALFPTPHGDKLRALLKNQKLPVEDRQRVEQTIKKYEEWLQQLSEVRAVGEELVKGLVSLLNAYKRIIEVGLIFEFLFAFIHG